MENRQACLQSIDTEKTRMCVYSFLLRSLTVVLVLGLFVLGVARSATLFVCLAYFPAFLFWFLDSYYVRQEKLLGKLYERIESSNEMLYPFPDTTAVVNEVESLPRIALSRILVTFYGFVIAAVALHMSLRLLSVA